MKEIRYDLRRQDKETKSMIIESSIPENIREDIKEIEKCYTLTGAIKLKSFVR